MMLLPSCIRSAVWAQRSAILPPVGTIFSYFLVSMSKIQVSSNYWRAYSDPPWPPIS